MHLSLLLPLATFLAATTVSAAPTTNPLCSPRDAQSNLKRTCGGVQYPALRTSPSQGIPFSVALSSSSSLSSSPSPVEIGFTIPSDAVGPCSLMLNLPAGVAQVSGSVQVNVVALDGPSAGSLVGTTTFADGAVATINSFACRPQMCYSLEIAQDDGSGAAAAVQFVEMQGAGLTMTYDC